MDGLISEFNAFVYPLTECLEVRIIISLYVIIAVALEKKITDTQFIKKKNNKLLFDYQRILTCFTFFVDSGF